MLGWMEALVLGIVQGATEYLPVSSSGHLVLAQHLFGLREPVLFFDIVLHLGTLVAVLGYYRREVMEIVAETLSGATEIVRGKGVAAVLQARPAFRFGLLIVVGTVPTAILGVAFEDAFERLFGSVRWVGVMLMVTGTVLLLTRLVGDGAKGREQPRWRDALLIGLAQGLAITPGISRSGATIAAALFLGVERSVAARFSFLLSVPSILGALVLKAGDASDGVGALALGVGFVAALLTGYLCLALLVRLVRAGRFSWFGPYCLAIGLVAIFLIGR